MLLQSLCVLTDPVNKTFVELINALDDHCIPTKSYFP